MKKKKLNYHFVFRGREEERKGAVGTKWKRQLVSEGQSTNSTIPEGRPSSSLGDDCQSTWLPAEHPSAPPSSTLNNKKGVLSEIRCYPLLKRLAPLPL